MLRPNLPEHIKLMAIRLKWSPEQLEEHLRGEEEKLQNARAAGIGSTSWRPERAKQVKELVEKYPPNPKEIIDV